jgi:hypothetical protein
MTERSRPHASSEELADRLTRVSDAVIELLAGLGLGHLEAHRRSLDEALRRGPEPR